MGKKTTQILMSKPVYLGLSILDLNKTVMYKFWYYYVKPKFCEIAKLHTDIWKQIYGYRHLHCSCKT